MSLSKFDHPISGFGVSCGMILGLLQSGLALCCYDAPTHLVEEICDVQRVAPRAIVVSVVAGGVVGLAFLVSICFCIQDLESAVNSSTGVPFVQLLYDCTSSVPATTILGIATAMLNINASVGLTVGASRTI